jgi:hypothetical protein
MENSVMVEQIVLAGMGSKIVCSLVTPKWDETEFLGRDQTACGRAKCWNIRAVFEEGREAHW